MVDTRVDTMVDARVDPTVDPMVDPILWLISGSSSVEEGRQPLLP